MDKKIKETLNLVIIFIHVIIFLNMENDVEDIVIKNNDLCRQHYFIKQNQKSTGYID
jgi:hypothetical protein